MNEAVATLKKDDPFLWRERAVPHFWRLLLGVTALFIATEIVAATGLVAHLRPLALAQVCGNILFAIGFGCPLVLYLSSLPRPREILATAATGLVLAALLWAGYQEVAVPQAIAGLGLASLATLGLRAWRQTGAARTNALLFLLPAVASLVFTLEVGIFFQLNSSIFPETYDSYAYVVDGAHGLQFSFVVGRLFAAVPWLAFICSAIYLAPPPGLVFVYALQLRGRRPPPVDIITVILFLGLTGYSLYFVVPVCGPLFAFGDAFPGNAPPVAELLGHRLFVPFTLADGRSVPRDGMPSLHMASVVLAYWHARPYGRWARLAAGVFVAGTFLATLGRGEHYLVDLVVALPLTLAVHAACTPARPDVRGARRTAFAGAAGLLAGWYVLLLWGTGVLSQAPVLAWAVTLGTVAAVVGLERQLYCAAWVPAAGHESGIAPGPRGHWLLGSLPEFRRDVLRLLLESRAQFGDVVRFRLGPSLIHLVSHPDHVQHVLVSHQHNYNKATRSSSKIRQVAGEGLLTSNGDTWLRQRRLMQPAFHPQRLAAFTGIVTETTTAMLRRWEVHARQGGPLDVASEMMRLTYTVVGRALFGSDVSEDIEEVERAATVVMEETYRRLETPLDVPASWPTPGNRRFRRALQRVDQVVFRILEARRRGPNDAADLLSVLLRRRDEETGQGMTDEQIRNEAITLLLAGHETTANALAWTWYLLAQHPEAADRIRAEDTEVLGGRPPTFDELGRLAYTTRVFQEALRLYPPIWIMERRVLADDVIDGFAIPRGSTVVLSPYVTHRHPDLWEKPDVFDPDRFLPERSAGRPHYAYFPFGGGQRLCMGNNFALMEARLIVPLVLRAFRLDLLPGTVVVPKPGITLRARDGLPMILRPVGDGRG